MGITIARINDNEHFEYKGDVIVTGSIGKNATVIIKDGNLTVGGNVEERADVSLTEESKSKSSVVVSSGVFFTGNVSIGGVSTGKVLNVKGDVADYVTFKSHNAEFAVEGSVGNQCAFKTHNGDITAGIVGESTSLETHNGDISSGNVNRNSALKTHNGDINAGDMAENSRAISHNGNVRVANAHKSATIDTHNGNVYENGVKRKKEKAHGQTSVSIGGMSFIGGGRIIVNGRDITDIVNSTAGNSNDVKEPQAPVRYTKR